MYFVNAYKFHTKAWADGKKTTNSGLYVKGVTGGGEDDFYDTIHHIYELEYVALNKKILLFYCEWFDLQLMLVLMEEGQAHLTMKAKTQD